MAVLTIFLSNGDYFRLGKSKKYTLAAYQAILGSQDEFIELTMISDELPKFAFRRSEISALVLDPADETTVFYSSAMKRAVVSDFDAAIKQDAVERLRVANEEVRT